jgi:hypothetical protein
MRTLGLTLLGILLGAVAGAAAGIAIGLAWVTLFDVGNFEGLGGFVVGLLFMPLGLASGAVAGGIWFFRRARRQQPTAAAVPGEGAV